MSSFRHIRLVLAALLVAGSVAYGAVPAAAKGAQSGLELSLDRARVSTRIGDSSRFNSTVVNSTGVPFSGLVAHLNIVSLRKGVYVDPEDWSSQRTQYLPTLRPGESLKLPWSVEAVNSGDFGIYVVVLPSRDPESRRLAVSPALNLHSTEQKTLNSDGVLPLVLGVPLLLGLLTFSLRVRRRR
jgi:hypothetical protein